MSQNVYYIVSKMIWLFHACSCLFNNAVLAFVVLLVVFSFL